MKLMLNTFKLSRNEAIFETGRARITNISILNMGHNDLDKYYAKKVVINFFIFEHIFQPLVHM